ncbi:hypothetical protein M758_10G161100 [Ceratodon purpureus]|uniref:Uncharacterized protein n=1 Tax=Ceratodon purpureus TaxID=3225 RepID=A0A8T0GNU0_CERPU|nr:hypothetical protein KC19_10G165900 [Ceratodon purpureus]KAG0604308.1 hypothetical protein M758_10G161100 [Ceratodon purpureus]
MATCGSRFAAAQQPALLLVMAVIMLATACAPGAHAQLPPVGDVSIANVTIVNSLSASLVARLPAPPLGSEQSVTVAPGKKGVLKVLLTAPLLLPSIFYTYENTVYSASNNAIARVVVLTNTLSINLSTPCVNGQSPGLQATSTADLGLGPMQLNSECALPTSA